MKIQHTPYHWLLVVLVLLAFLLTFGEAHGQAKEKASAASPTADMSLRKDAAPAPDRSVAKDQRSATKKIARAVQRTISRARHGTSEIDTRTAAAGR